MNGFEFKREIERIFKVARKIYPSITDDMLYNNGAIYYMNRRDGTKFDWNWNNRLCEFYVFHKNEMGFIKAFVNADNSIEVCIYEDGGIDPTYKFTEEMEGLKASSFANLMNYIADEDDVWDNSIDSMDWDVDTMECDDITEVDRNGEECDDYEDEEYY